MAPAAKRPLRDAKQISRIGLGEFARFMPIQYAPELDHSHTLKGFRTAHPWPSKGPSITGQIVRYLNRTYHVLSTGTRSRLSRVVRSDDTRLSQSRQQEETPWNRNVLWVPPALAWIVSRPTVPGWISTRRTPDCATCCGFICRHRCWRI